MEHGDAFRMRFISGIIPRVTNNILVFVVPGDDWALVRLGPAAFVLLLATTHVLDAMGGLEISGTFAQ